MLQISFTPKISFKLAQPHQQIKRATISDPQPQS